MKAILMGLLMTASVSVFAQTPMSVYEDLTHPEGTHNAKDFYSNGVYSMSTMKAFTEYADVLWPTNQIDHTLNANYSKMILRRVDVNNYDSEKVYTIETPLVDLVNGHYVATGGVLRHTYDVDGAKANLKKLEYINDEKGLFYSLEVSPLDTAKIDYEDAYLMRNIGTFSVSKAGNCFQVNFLEATQQAGTEALAVEGVSPKGNTFIATENVNKYLFACQ